MSGLDFKVAYMYSASVADQVCILCPDLQYTTDAKWWIF